MIHSGHQALSSASESAQGSAERTILLIDDDPDMHELCGRQLMRAGYQLLSAHDGSQGLELLRSGDVDLILLDYLLPDRDGISLYQEILSNPALSHVRGVPVIVLTAVREGLPGRQELLDLGVSMFLEKPFGAQELAKVIENVFLAHRLRLRDRRKADTHQQELARMQEENLALRTQMHEAFGFDKIIGITVPMRELLDRAAKIAATDANVLLHGENGTGRELLARSIHAHSLRQQHLFLAVDCAALPGELLEQELFGYTREGLNGRLDRPGRFEQVRGGTLFLEEISALSPDLQAKLVRVLQEGRFRRLGGREWVGVHFRVISTTSRDLQAMLRDREFRRDLYDSLHAIVLFLPPLRDRKDDIPLLCRRFLQEFARTHQQPLCELAPEAVKALLGHSWPGNVRELKNVMERAATLAHGGRLEADDVVAILGEPGPPREAGGETTAARATSQLSLREARQQWVEQFERKYLIDLLNQYDGNISRVARRAGVHRMTIYRMLKNYDITISPRRAQ